MMKINQKLRDNLENRTFVYDNCVKWVKNIVDDVNSVLLKRPNRPCSYHVGFINAFPTTYGKRRRRKFFRRRPVKCSHFIFSRPYNV